MKKTQISNGMKDPLNLRNILDRNCLVWNKVFNKVYEYYDHHIERTDRAYSIMDDRTIASFPEPTGISVNMLPLKFFDVENTLPEYLQGYRHMISCIPISRFDYDANDLMKYTDRRDRIVYLTVHESMVPVGKSQRRPGLHIERPLAVRNSGQIHKMENPYDYNSIHHSYAWGLGCYRMGPSGDIPVDGIYMASNLSDSCEVHSARIRDPAEFTDPHGGIEHARDYLAGGRKLKSNEICWLTDVTPHESLPVVAPASDPTAEFVQRSFFRLVVGDISIWYSKHNTHNPLGIQPDCPVSDEDKYDSNI